MKAKNLNGMPEHRANLSRTGFDMGQEFAFTSSVGMILPVYQDFLNVGESVHFSGDLITRTQPLVTAAMCDVDVWLDWFFVPASMIFTLWPSKRWLTNDFISDFYEGIGGDDTFPIFDINGYLTEDSTWEYGDNPSVFYTNAPYGKGFECFGKSSFRLANHFGFNPYAIFRGDGGASTDYAHADNPNVFPIFPLAYQAIFQDYYRLPLGNFVTRRVGAFNCDSYFSQPADPILDSNKSLFLLHYRPRNFDYFTGFKVNPLLSDVNSSVASDDLNTFISKIDSYLDDNPVSVLGVDAEPSEPSDNTQTGTNYSRRDEFIGTAQLRNMFAVEKLLRVTGRAKKDYDSQVLAHFGFKVPHDVKHELTHICQQHAIIHIGEVISTSDTISGDTGSALGAIGGKGYGVINAPNKPYRFTAPVDGVFMCCYSSAPRQRYFGTFDKQNALTDRLSFYQPEYDKLGMQPLYRYEAEGFYDNTIGNRIGWQYRYEQWKRKYNRVSEAFASETGYYQRVNNNVSWVNATRPFASAFQTVPTGIGVEGKGLFVQPTDLNQIMVVQYDAGWSDDYLENAPIMFYTDPFIHAFRANVKKVSTMSSFGEPDLNGI